MSNSNNMNFKRFFFNKKGFSLIEVMVAFSILALAFVSLVQSFPFGASINKEAENVTEASYLTQEKIEELTSLAYEDINVGTIEERHRLSDDQDNYLYNYQRETEVDYVDGDLNQSETDEGMKKISVTIYYINSISKTEKSYNITTLKSDR